MEDTLRVALYARVSSQRQAEGATIHSQVAALENRIRADGHHLDPELRFLDDGVSGGTLIRPALERLRDLIYLGGVDRLYVHSPDRLARKYVYQALLLEEFQKQRVEVIFLNQELSDASPEGNLLLQMQGMIAEYERAKILERTRRGRRYSARQGKVSALGHAPYGYRYVPKHQGDGEARYDVMPEEARVVRELFHWVGVEGLSLADVVQRLTEQDVPTRTGQSRWDRATVRGILLNPAYYGLARFGKTRLQARPPGRRAARGRPRVPRQEKVARPAPLAEQEAIPVPSLISQELFVAVAERLEHNRRRQRQQKSGAQFLLSGLLVCGRCGSAYCGRRHRRQGEKRYVYYRCLGTDKYRHAGEPLCDNAAVSATLEDEVWSDVCDLLRQPQRLQRELRRRLDQPKAEAPNLARLQASLAQLKRQVARLIDLYATGHLEKEDFETRTQRVRQRLAAEERAYREHVEGQSRDADLEVVQREFARFAETMTSHLDRADFETRRNILRVLIKQIEVSADRVQIVYKVQPHPFVPSPDRGDLQHRLKFPVSPSD
jgi:site-specific DNA recombinase